MKSLKKKLEDLGIKFSESFSKGSSFLLSDGSYINMIEQEQFSREKKNRSVAHHLLDRFIISEKLITDEEYTEIHRLNKMRKRPYFVIALQERILRFTDNACVLNDGSNYGWENCYVDLPGTMPSGKQLEALIIWLDDRHYNNPPYKRRLDISLDDVLKTFNLDIDSTDDIIKEIKKLYRERDK